jgi:hypothetical protein
MDEACQMNYLHNSIMMKTCLPVIRYVNLEASEKLEIKFIWIYILIYRTNKCLL